MSWQPWDPMGDVRDRITAYLKEHGPAPSRQIGADLKITQEVIQEQLGILARTSPVHQGPDGNWRP
jgi:predicted ArsR family transcriptional regulator